MTIAIFGRTCSGKTTLAVQLARMLHAPVRHCGRVVLQRCKELGNSSPLSLAIVEHQCIDKETRRLAASPPVIIEGCFLDCVLEGFYGARFVQLECEEGVRRHRFEQRSGTDRRPGSFEEREDTDARLRSTLYGDRQPALRLLYRLNTESRTPAQCATDILEHLETIVNE